MSLLFEDTSFWILCYYSRAHSHYKIVSLLTIITSWSLPSHVFVVSFSFSFSSFSPTVFMLTLRLRVRWQQPQRLLPRSIRQVEHLLSSCPWTFHYDLLIETLKWVTHLLISSSPLFILNDFSINNSISLYLLRIVPELFRFLLLLLLVLNKEQLT